MNDPGPDDEHSCIFVRHVAIQAMDNRRKESMLRAADNRNRRIAMNCDRRTDSNLCTIDQNRECRTQCGEEFALAEGGKLYYSIYGQERILWDPKKHLKKRR